MPETVLNKTKQKKGPYCQRLFYFTEVVRYQEPSCVRFYSSCDLKEPTNFMDAGRRLETSGFQIKDILTERATAGLSALPWFSKTR